MYYTENHFCTPEQAKRLETLGVVFDHHAIWERVTDDEGKAEIVIRNIWEYDSTIGKQEKLCAAPNVAELGMLLPRNFASFYCGQGLWRIANTYHYAVKSTTYQLQGAWKGDMHTFTQIVGNTEADVRANLLILLIEKGIYTAEQANQSFIYHNTPTPAPDESPVD